MQVINIATVSVSTGNNLLSTDQVNALQAFNIAWVVVNPSVDIVLVAVTDDAGGFPGAVAGTTSNAPVTCPANTDTWILHRAGNLKAISTSGTATVKISLVNGV